jgi:vitamin B12 transporter
VEAPYPEQARLAGQEAIVTLELNIDAQGRVTGAKVLRVRTPSGDEPSFDASEFERAAAEACSRFVFDPARRRGVPAASRIAYDYHFELAPTPPPPMIAPPEAAPAVPELPLAAPPSPAAPLASEASTTPAPSAPSGVVDVTVRGARAEERLRRSAEAVQVVDTQRAGRQSADLGAVLGRSQGINVRRSGGRGSTARLSLNGLTDDQIRFFVDDLPLVFAGFGAGLGSIPVSLLRRVEVFRGVVPVRFGEDALGGAINLVTDASQPGSRASGSFELGSFGTYQATAGARHAFTDSPWFVSASGYWDRADNDYRIDVEVPDSTGRPQPARVRRFHDGYSALGGTLGGGFRGRAQRLDLRLFANHYSKELQHNVNMTVPYGEVESRETAYGGSARYETTLLGSLEVGAIAAYSLRFIHFDDSSLWAYDWLGRRVFQRPVAVGELGGPLIETRDEEHQVLGRLSARYALTDNQSLRMSVSTRFATRSSEERLSGDDEGRRGIITSVAGAEHELLAIEHRLDNILFIKDYLYRPSTDVPAADARLEQSTTSHSVSAGDSLRFRFTEWLTAKASYEYATRLPRPDEVFGDAALISPNLELEPETSHNVNLSLLWSVDTTRLGSMRADLNGFLRHARNLIILLPSNDLIRARHENIFNIRSLGADASLQWSSPGDYVSLNGNVTWMDLRNVSESGPFAAFDGERVPNRPWLFAAAGARLAWTGLATGTDVLSLEWSTRYVYRFFPSWENLGAQDTKADIPAQLVHSVLLGYELPSDPQLSANLELQNVMDEATYDFLGVQRPGRAFFFKLTLQR